MLKMSRIAILISLCVAPLSHSVGVFDFPATLYTIPTDFRPAFASLIFNPTTGEYDLAYSSFTGSPGDVDKILQYPSVSTNHIDKTKMTSHLITDQIFWPNEVGGIPDGAFGSYHYWTSASAFFLPNKDNGSISLIDMTDSNIPGEPVIISGTDDGIKWYYHRVLWEDLDYDGDFDAITARAYGNATHTFEAQLVWFENPGLEKATPNWNMHIIHEGEEDVGFRLQNLTLPDGSTTLVIISAGFFRQALTLTWTTDGNWSNSDSIQHRILDNFGWYFDVRMADLNMDGNLDIIATTWSRPDVRYFGSLVAYEMPSGDWRTDNWRRRVISRDFRDIFITGNGAPGSMLVFWPTKELETNKQKPHIILSGDDDGRAYLFVPESQDPEDWSYTRSTVFRAFGTVGGIAVGDVDGDGYTEIFVPAYSIGQLVVMSYKP